MNEFSFLLVRVIRASDGGFRHEKHEVSIDTVLSCMPSCTEPDAEPKRRFRDQLYLKHFANQVFDRRL